MKKDFAILAVFFVGLGAAVGKTPLAGESSAAPARDYPIRPVPATEVKFTDEFWAPRLETNRTATIPSSFAKCEETHRRKNFLIAAGKSDEAWEGDFGFNDSDVYKVIEGAAYSLMTHPDPKLQKYLDELIADVGAAQETSGYLYTLWTAKKKPANYDTMVVRVRNRPFDNLQHDHELYNYGHLYEAATAHFAATGKRSLLEIALRTAEDAMAKVGPGKTEATSGHPEVEIGLVKLYRTTGDRKYLDFAQYLIDLRGRTTKDRPQLWGEYCQDHKPLVEQDEAVGHAVRAMYLYAGVADVAALTGNQAYIDALNKLWTNVVGKKLYVTGGVGATGSGEAFGDNYDLPNSTAYCETCAQIANVLWNQRMFLLHGDPKYVDVLERTLYNGYLSGVAFDGTHFFYPNPLASDGSHERSPWFGCPCCPSNVCRFMPSLPGFAYAVKDQTAFVNLFVQGEAALTIDGRNVVVHQETNYPWDGRVHIRLSGDLGGGPLTLKVRIPEWARNIANSEGLYSFADAPPPPPQATCNGESIWSPADGGYATVTRTWKPGDAVVIGLPMPVRRIVARDEVAADRGRVAISRGPLVFCVEHPDVPDGKQVEHIMLPDDAELTTRFDEDLLHGVQVIEAQAQALAERQASSAAADQAAKIDAAPAAIRMIPYFAWAHRGRGQMAVWLPRDVEHAYPAPAPTVANRSKITASPGTAGSLAVIADSRDPGRPGEGDRFFHWWPRKGEAAWVEYDFAEAARIAGVELWWFDDTGRGECRVPASWKLLGKDDAGEWREVDDPSAYSCERGRANRCEFTPVTTTGLRIELSMQPGFSAGVHEWRVTEARE